MEQFILQPAAGREDPSCREMKLLDGEIRDKRGNGEEGEESDGMETDT